MNKLFVAVLAFSLLAVGLTACGWKPEVSAVPLTAPWAQMNLPVKENAVVWESGDKIFQSRSQRRQENHFEKLRRSSQNAGLAVAKI